ncbi:MAG TPA: thiamine pyrophosphate-dependent enzyme, partial [Spirochaetales bacterium]|nr:thiamine pyrophosphate-dependent enzyme [Spirochaetales bacterium]
GQVSPMTPKGALGTTAPYGNIDRSFDLVQLAQASGATYVGRATTYHVPLLIDLIEHALQNDGFSVVEAMTPCPTYFGRKNKMGGAVELLTMLKDNAVNIKAASALSEEKLKGKFLIGEFVNKSEPEFTNEYAKMVEQVQRKFDTFQGGLRECEQNSD